MEKPIVNIDELEFAEFGQGEKFHASRAGVSPLIGGSKLGYAVVRLQPGKRAWPYHAHYINEEAFFILEGEGTLRHADEEFPIRQGDFIAAPPDPKQAHQIINTSDAELAYIAISTMEKSDVWLYPDSNKFGAFYSPDGMPRSEGSFLIFSREESGVEYWDGEDTD